MKGRRTPSVGTAIALIALFVALGGTSYAMSQINGSQIKNRSIAGNKLKKHSVNGTDVCVSGFPKVPAAHTADSATSATTATKAGTITGSITGSQVSSAVANATNATTAQNLSGNSFAQIDSSCTNSGAGNCSSTAIKVLNDLGGLTLSLTCPTPADADLHGSSSTSGSTFAESEIENGGAAVEGFNVTSFSTTGASLTITPNAIEHFVYTQASGFEPRTTNVVTGTVNLYNNGGTCTVVGNAQLSTTSFRLILAPDRKRA
jgi:hypothetical protein